MKVAIGRVWTWYRGLALWGQVVLGFVAVVILVSPFTSDDKQTVAADRSPSTTVSPATTPGVIPEVTTTITVTTTVAPTTTSSLAVGLLAGDDTSVVRVIDGDTIEMSGGTKPS